MIEGTQYNSLSGSHLQPAKLVERGDYLEFPELDTSTLPTPRLFCLRFLISSNTSNTSKSTSVFLTMFNPATSNENVKPQANGPYNRLLRRRHRRRACNRLSRSRPARLCYGSKSFKNGTTRVSWHRNAYTRRAIGVLHRRLCQ